MRRGTWQREDGSALLSVAQATWEGITMQVRAQWNSNKPSGEIHHPSCPSEAMGWEAGWEYPRTRGQGYRQHSSTKAASSPRPWRAQVLVSLSSA